MRQFLKFSLDQPTWTQRPQNMFQPTEQSVLYEHHWADDGTMHLFLRMDTMDLHNM